MVSPPTASPAHEWTNVGVVDYNAASKRFLVKRVLVPDKLLEKKVEKEEGTVQGSGVEAAAEAPTEERGSSPKDSKAVSLHVCLCVFVFTTNFRCVVLLAAAAA